MNSTDERTAILRVLRRAGVVVPTADVNSVALALTTPDDADDVADLLTRWGLDLPGRRETVELGQTILDERNAMRAENIRRARDR